jgi:hypothetical protein
MSQSVMARPGRPPIYSRVLAEAFLRRVEDGEKIMQICADPQMPAWATVVQWKRKNETFATLYARARATSAERYEFKAEDIADEATDKDSAAAARVKFEVAKWIAAKRDPAKYADKLLHTGADGQGPIEHKLALDYTLLDAQQLVALRQIITAAQLRRDESAPIEGEAEEVEGE